MSIRGSAGEVATIAPLPARAIPGVGPATMDRGSGFRHLNIAVKKILMATAK